jgi:quinol monooxygenase YgiN
VAGQIVLIVRFYVNAASKPLFQEKLKELFEHIRHEHTFVNASLQEDIEHPEQLLVYELWQETRESFMKNQMTKSYRSSFERAILNLKVVRTPQWLKPLAAWKP